MCQTLSLKILVGNWLPIEPTIFVIAAIQDGWQHIQVEDWPKLSGAFIVILGNGH